MSGIAKRIAPLMMALGLLLVPAAQPTVRAQEEAPGVGRRVEGGSGSRLPGSRPDHLAGSLHHGEVGPALTVADGVGRKPEAGLGANVDD